MRQKARPDLCSSEIHDVLPGVVFRLCARAIAARISIMCRNTRLEYVSNKLFSDMISEAAPSAQSGLLIKRSLSQSSPPPFDGPRVQTIRKGVRRWGGILVARGITHCRLAVIRAQLRPSLLGSPMCDGPGFMREKFEPMLLEYVPSLPACLPACLPALAA